MIDKVTSKKIINEYSSVTPIIGLFKLDSGNRSPCD
jgi:hypothetical protein